MLSHRIYIFFGLLLILRTNRQAAGSEHQQAKRMEYSRNMQFRSSFSRKHTVSLDRNATDGRVEVTNTWNYKTTGSNQFGPCDSPYGLTDLPTTFGAQWGIATPKDTEQTEPSYFNAEISLFESQYGVKASKDGENSETTYDRAEVSLYGPQWGIPALSPDDDLYGDSEEDLRNDRCIRKLTTVQVVEVSSDNMSPPQNKSIPQNYFSKLISVSRENDIVHKSADIEPKPKTKAEVARPAKTLQPERRKLLRHQVLPQNSHPISVSRSDQDTNSNSPKTSVTLMNKNIDQFADLGGADSLKDEYDYSASAPKAGPRSCIICTDDFSASLKPPAWITILCNHEPSVCCGCMALSIKSDLESKIWNQITCPECKTLLVYEDIQRLADPETFAKYDSSLRPMNNNC
jgi:hypothetical protein